MALKFTSFADLLPTGGDGGNSGEACRKANVHASLPAPTGQKNSSPRDLASGVDGVAEKSGGVTETQYPCGLQEGIPTDPTIPTGSKGFAYHASNDSGMWATSDSEVDTWSTPNSECWCEAVNTAEVDVFAAMQPADWRPQLLGLTSEPVDWRELAATYHAHHLSCPTCIAAGRGHQYGRRCGTGLQLWNAYAEPLASDVECIEVVDPIQFSTTEHYDE